MYDDAGRVTSSVEKNARGVIITGFEYTYDILGRVSTEKRLDKNLEICYTYDRLSRVTLRTVTDLATCNSSQETFNYDSAGNILYSATNSDYSAYTYDRNNRLISYNGMNVTYDADGNMTSAYLDCTGELFRYDSTNRLIGTNTNAYTYNAENVRIRNLCGESETTYVYDTNAKLSRLLVKTTDGRVTKYVYGRGLIGEEANGVFKTYHFDYRGSTVAITDINGNITDRFEYDTYGKLTGRTGTSDIIFLYNGRDGVVTDGNGLIYMRARYYAPELRRFINADILAGDIASGITLNRYAYANGNPVSMIDPKGLAAERGAAANNVKLLSNTDQDLFISASIPDWGEPNSYTSWYNGNGDLMERWYGPDGRAIKDRHHTDHGHPKNHPYNPHDQYWDWSDPEHPKPDSKSYPPSDSMTPPNDDDDDKPSGDQPESPAENPSENPSENATKESNTSWLDVIGGFGIMVAAGIGFAWVVGNDVTGVGAADDGLIPILTGLLTKGWKLVAG